jgi:hypothetical protein
LFSFCVPSMQCPAERLLSESTKHSLLVYRSTEDQWGCFKFCYKRANSDSYAYVCMGCQNTYKAGNPVQIRSWASFSSLRGTRLHRSFRTSDFSVSFYVDVYQIVFRKKEACRYVKRDRRNCRKILQSFDYLSLGFKDSICQWWYSVIRLIFKHFANQSCGSSTEHSSTSQSDLSRHILCMPAFPTYQSYSSTF